MPMKMRAYSRTHVPTRPRFHAYTNAIWRGLPLLPSRLGTRVEAEDAHRMTVVNHFVEEV